MADRRDILDKLLEKARKLPKAPGVYLMKDAQGRVIYVGKASVLPDRVSSYFVPSAATSGGLGPKKLGMLDIITDFDTLECEGEWEALLTENRLIKDIRPRFNARLTDDKSFPYLVITTREDFPGVYITRDPANPDFKGAKVLGPFTSVYALRESIQLLQRVFKFRTCHLEIHEPEGMADGGAGSADTKAAGTPRDASRAAPSDSTHPPSPIPHPPPHDPRRHFRPCLLHPIGQCTAPCAAKISKADYNEDIQRFIRFIESKRSVMLRQMRKEMEEASANLDFERAATLRDQIHAIGKLDERGKRSQNWQPEAEGFYQDPRKGLESLRRALGMDEPIRYIECFDIAHLQGGETVGSKVAFIDGKPLKNEYRRYRIKTVPGGNDDYASIREVISRRYREAGKGQELYPDVILIDGGLGQLHAAQDVFDQLEVKPPKVISLAKKEELIFTQEKSEPIKLGRENPGLKLCQALRDEAHRFAQHYHHILRRKKTLGE